MKYCNQCGLKLDLLRFVSPTDGHVMQDCDTCRERRRRKLPVLDHRVGLSPTGPLKVKIIPVSHNRKLGPIPAVYVSANTCPPSCKLYNNGCYGEDRVLRRHWRDVERYGSPWDVLVGFVKQLPAGQLWRYAVVGDLPGQGEAVDEGALQQLIDANKGCRGFGMTHKKSTQAIQLAGYATRQGLTINLSANSVAEAQSLVGLGPVVTVLPKDAPRRYQPFPGVRVVRCPATVGETDCATCGLCAVADKRRPIIGFPAHGAREREVGLLAASCRA